MQPARTNGATHDRAVRLFRFAAVIPASTLRPNHFPQMFGCLQPPPRTGRGGIRVPITKMDSLGHSGHVLNPVAVLAVSRAGAHIRRDAP